jgi:hypothetical protein
MHHARVARRRISLWASICAVLLGLAGAASDGHAQLIDAGAGDDRISGFKNGALVVKAGSGRDTVVVGGWGSLVFGGLDPDDIYLLPHVRVADATGEDRLYAASQPLRGATPWGGADDGWVEAPEDGVRYGIDRNGQLVIRSILNSGDTRVANYWQAAAQGAPPGGIVVGHRGLGVRYLLGHPLLGLWRMISALGG